MAALLDQLQQRIIARTDFVNDDLESAIERHTNNAFSLAVATAEFEAKVAALELDPIATSNAVLQLSQVFGESFPAPTPERTAQIKSLVAELVDESDLELERKIEALFNAALDFETSINVVNETVDAIAASE